jgi:hypothetical protein
LPASDPAKPYHVLSEKASMPIELELHGEAEFDVDAKLLWNSSGVELVAGGAYKLVARVANPAEHPWKDWWVLSDLETGWKGPAGALERLFRRRARAPQFPIYSLVGSIGTQPATFFLIGKEALLTPSRRGELLAFANDWPARYSNNHGIATVHVLRTA